MLAQFPNFEPISISAREGIDAIINKFPPYSDFNFVSLHSWNIKDNMQVSELDGNLVVRFKDYTSDKSFLSFIGEQKVDETLVTLLSYAGEHDLGSKLHLIPEHVITLIKNPDHFLVTEDRDNHDYIIMALKFSELEGPDYADNRYKIKKIKSDYANRLQVKKMVIDAKSTKEILDTFHLWRTESGKQDEEVADELGALQRLLGDSHHFGLDTLGIYIDDVMVAYSIYEVNGDYAVGHFMKASKRHRGLYALLKYSSAVDIYNQGAKYINYEQDLGIEGLRKSKILLRPETFLKKFTVRLAAK